MRLTHFISGLPRSGSTLLAAILRQNPRFHARMTSPVQPLFNALIRAMSVQNDFSIFITDEIRRRILISVFEAYYSNLPQDNVIFDTNRGWCAELVGLNSMFPNSYVICCVRNPAWILDSFERLLRRNAFHPSKIFNCEPSMNVYSRAELVMKPGVGLCGGPFSAFRQAWYSEEANRLIVIRYEVLTARPVEVIAQLYDVLGEPRFTHDFENLNYDESEYDALIGTPGLHKVAQRVTSISRETILPPELFRTYSNCFWNEAGQNPRNIMVL